MKLGLNDLHPGVADILKARVWSMQSDRHARPEDVEMRAVLARRWKGLGWRILGAAALGGLITCGAVTASGANGAAIGGLTFMGAYFSAFGTGLGSVLMARLGRNTSVSAEELRALSTGLELGRPEMVYLETVCALLEAGDNISEQTGHDILTTLGTLLEQARYVNDRRERLRNATGAESAAELAEERQRLAARIAKVEDPQARQDLTQSLAMCDERLGNARELSPLLERLDAQWEVIGQTLLSVQASVSRLQVAPTAITAPDVEEVKRVVGQVTAQTQAVEDAVQQVMALRS
jgi:hypothetical protein